MTDPDADLPPDVAQAKALIGMYLLSLPPDEARAAMLTITQTLAAAALDAQGTEPPPT